MMVVFVKAWGMEAYPSADTGLDPKLMLKDTLQKLALSLEDLNGEKKAPMELRISFLNF